MRAMVVIAVMCALLLSAGAAVAQYGYGSYDYAAAERQQLLRAKIGWFEPGEGELSGDVAFGLDYLVPYEKSKYIGQPYDLYLTVDRLHAENHATEATTWSVLVGVNLKSREFYYGTAIGMSRQELETPSGDRHDSEFAWELGLGVNLGRNGFGEVKYRDGGQDENSGVVGYLGTRF